MPPLPTPLLHKKHGGEGALSVAMTGYYLNIWNFPKNLTKAD
jgi:hypothetical protein